MTAPPDALESAPVRLSLLPGATPAEDGDVIKVSTRTRARIVGGNTPGLLAALRMLAGAGGTLRSLRDQVLAHEPDEALTSLDLCLMELTSAGLLCEGVDQDGTPLMVTEPLAPAYRPGTARPDPSARLVLSRFSFIRRESTRVLLESPCALARIVMHDRRAAALAGALGTPSTLAELVALDLHLSPSVLRACVELLWKARMLEESDPAGQSEDGPASALDAWEFHDLLFHSRSRRGRHRSPYGATYRLRGRSAPVPAIKPRMIGESVALYQPDLEAVRAADPPFTTVLEARRSRRLHDVTPMTTRQLGEFLYRACHVRAMVPAGAQEVYEATRRVYPSGGATYPLEVYVAAYRCQGLSPGLYHYRPDDHALTRLGAPAGSVERLGRTAAYAARSPIPQVLLILSARVQRVAWKYSSLAYATILKEVGALYQTMYLVATAMGLAGCALGGGDSDAFAAAAGVDYYTEPSVGEFMLGAVPLGDTPQARQPAQL
jgi:SagB-type dehydrogenase family enzyme